METNRNCRLPTKVQDKMDTRIDSTRMFSGDPFGSAQAVCPAADGVRVCVCGSPLPLKNGWGPGMAVCDQSITKLSPVIPASKPLPVRRRIFGNRLLWQRQSQISWKWIRATPR
jgi:hypothetical protein